MTENDAPRPQAIDLPPRRPTPAAPSTGRAGGAPASIEMSPRDVERSKQRKLEADRRAQEMLDLHHMDGRITQIPANPRAVQPPPSRIAQPPAAIGEHPLLEKALMGAHDADPRASSDPRFRSRLDKCLGLRTAALMSWGDADLTPLTAAADTQAQIAKQLGTLDAARIADECRIASTKPPNLIERMTGANKPAFYKQTLTTARTMLADLAQQIESACDALRPRLETLRLDILALQVASTTFSDPAVQATAAGRHRTLVGGQQMGAMALQTLENTKASNIKLMQDIDQLLTVVIPGWTLAQS